MKLVLQFLLINVFFFIGVAIQQLTQFPIPGSIFGLVFLFLALHFGLVKLEWVEEAGKWLLAELLLFFIPAAVGIVQYPEMAGWNGFQILLIILVSTILVMGITGFVADFLSKRRKEDEQ
ncbi:MULTISPECIES: CidA/LrgA family protein [Pontibacillus]|uniref:CidA/LrgA family protein n=1 Tax=Pontibacillus chungwhensis TaxID=265426 RepID=A0ABY8V262_9BACI|nr:MULTISPECIES: CidA/LrgA family protein [Pontibacillus]MCD5322424.1 CidA/LrgA family protein [Pontibacillus sp. HN14]WIF99710.1 CidA/LrgA family protein [Pontibacillus chungwhensis]